MKLKTRKYIFASVADCRRESKGDFYLKLPELDTETYTTNRLFIKKGIIPYNWKRVTSTTKTITYIHQNGTTHTWYLTEGNPSILDLIANMTTLFGNDLDFEFDYIQSRFIFHNHNQNQSFTLATTAYEMLGFEDASPVTIPGATSYITPNPVDVRPSPIIEIRCDVSTEGQEVLDNGTIADTPILCAIAMDVQPFSHKVWLDDNGLYFADITNENRELRFTLTDTNGRYIEPQSYPYFIFGIDTYVDDERALLDTQQEALKLQKYDILLRQQK